MKLQLSIYLYTLAVSPSLGGSRQHKKQQNNRGFHSVLPSNDEGLSRVWMDGTAGVTQPILPRLPQLTSLHR